MTRTSSMGPPAPRSERVQADEPPSVRSRPAVPSTACRVEQHGRCIGLAMTQHAQRDTDCQLRAALSAFPHIELALLFGSVARGQAHAQSDIDLAVASRRALTAEQKIALIEALAERTGRPIDLVDLRTVGEPLLGQILRYDRRLLGTDRAYGQLISRHLFDQADFMPYRARVLAERRAAWIGK